VKYCAFVSGITRECANYSCELQLRAPEQRAKNATINEINENIAMMRDLVTS